MADFPEAAADAEPRTTRRRWRRYAAAAALLGVAGLGAAIWWLVLRDAPPPATLEAAVEGLETTTTVAAAAPGAPRNTSPSASSTTLATTTDLDGTWSVDTGIGSFDDFTNSWVGYRIDEELDPIGANTAVGRTPAVRGSLTLDGATVLSVTVEADLGQLQSDSGVRDDQLRTRGLETNTFPTATFVLAEPIVLDTVPAEARSITTEAVGELTLHGVSQPVTLTLEAELVGDVIAVVGRTEIALADYAIEPPTGFRVLRVAGTGELELQLFFTRT